MSRASNLPVVVADIHKGDSGTKAFQVLVLAETPRGQWQAMW
jgi:hypothetical protein